MKTQRYNFERQVERQVERASLESQEWLKREFRTILESEKDYTRKADYIGFSIVSIDNKIDGIEEEIKELLELKANLKAAKEIALITGAEIFQEYGIDKIEGLGISSITIAKESIKTKTKLKVLNEDALIKDGYFKVILDQDAIIQAYSKADERAKILNYCEVSLITEKSNAKLKINKKRGVNNTDIEKVEEVA
jgi:hypothetical protein